MSIIQFLRILWAYRLLTLATTATTILGAIIAIMLIPPSYEARARVMLNILKPDPVTGEMIAGNGARTFIATQRELITDYNVAGQAVDALGWANNPDNIAAYASQKTADGDIRRWLAQRIMDRTNVSVVNGTNILEISFKAGSAVEARTMANALKDAYIESSLAGRRRDATRNADWYDQQAQKEKQLVEAADAAKTAYERDNGIVMQDDKTDVETARLRALAAQSAGGSQIVMPSTGPTSSAAEIQLTQLDAQIAQASQTLGANHPALIDMKVRRASLAKLVADEKAVAARPQPVSKDITRELAAQTTRVIGNRDKIERLTQLQAEVNLHREQMAKALSRASELRQETAVADPGITVLSNAVTPRNPSFPNKPLILGGGAMLGAGLGLLLSLILELLNRRVRGVEDLQNGAHVPLLAVITPYSNRGQRWQLSAAIARRLLPRFNKPAAV
jgi:succinoglycan biosynthesis transport protein ExoP